MLKATKERLLKTLKDFGRISTSRIAGIMGMDYTHTNKLLEELLKEKKVIKEKETQAVYWRLK